MAEAIETLDEEENTAADRSVRLRTAENEQPSTNRANFRFGWLRGIFKTRESRNSRQERHSGEHGCSHSGVDWNNDKETSRRRKKRSKSSNMGHSDFHRSFDDGLETVNQRVRISWSSFKKRIRKLRNRSNSDQSFSGESNITVSVDGQRLADSPVLKRSNATAAGSSDSNGSSKHDSGCLKSLLEKREEFCIPKKICKVICCPWYWGNIDRFEAAVALQAKVDGYFLLRKSAHPDFLFTISFKRFNTTMHVRIESGYDIQDSQEVLDEFAGVQWTDPGRFSPTYSRLIELIDMCCQPYEGSIYNMPLLVNPLKRNHPLSLKDIARAQVYNVCEYSSIESLNIPEELKHYVKEYRFKIKNANNQNSLTN